MAYLNVTIKLNSLQNTRIFLLNLLKKKILLMLELERWLSRVLAVQAHGPEFGSQHPESKPSILGTPVTSAPRDLMHSLASTDSGVHTHTNTTYME